MSKRVTDLSVEELEGLARQAWSTAARTALAKGLSVTGSRDGRRYRYRPDGRIEDLGGVGDSTNSTAAGIGSPIESGMTRAPKKQMDAPARKVPTRG